MKQISAKKEKDVLNEERKMDTDIKTMSGKIYQIIILILLFSLVLSFYAFADGGPKWVGAFFVKGKVGLKWQALEGASKYNIYRKIDGDFEQIATLEKTHHFDTDVSPGSVNIYKIAGVSADGTELFSIEKSVSIPGGSVGAFKPPVWVGLRIDRNKIFCKWDKVPGSMAYNIYRSTTSGSGYEVVGNVTIDKYADKAGLVQGETYYYVLSALNEEFEETEFSEEMSIKFGVSLEEQKALEAEANKIVLTDIKMTYLFDITTAGSSGDMNQPADVFVNSKGNIYITDALNAQVNCYDNAGKFLFSFGEKTDQADRDDPLEGTFGIPFTLFIDKNDNVFVGDIENHDIQVFTADGKFIKRIRIDSGDKKKFRPNGIHVLDDDRIVVTDAGNHRFMIIDQSGKILFELGSRGDKPGEQFIFPDELTVTKDGIICIVDVINCRIQQFDLKGNFIRSFGQAGQSAGTFGRPKAITEDEKGQIWVSDAMGNIIQVFSPEGEIKSVVAHFDREDVFLATPRGMFIKDGRFYVVNRLPHRIMVFKLG